MQQATKSFLRWWLLVCTQLLAVAVAMLFDLHTHLWEHDQTKLGFAAIGTWIVTTLTICYWHAQAFHTKIAHLPKIGWFLSELCVALGLMGTVAGFLIMLGTSFENIDVNNTASLQDALTDMALGMSTALYTTLVGLITSKFTQVQLVNLEHLLDEQYDVEREL